MYQVKKTSLIILLNFLIFTQLILACNCDLTENYCDLLCCCDQSCTVDDYKAFNCQEDKKM